MRKLPSLMIAFLMLYSFSACNQAKEKTFNDEPLAQWIDPMIGTAGHAHTYPGPTLPHGMVQLSPDNGPDGFAWDWCGGYHASDSTIKGFSHTHISGTGVQDLCDILLMPATGTIQFTPGTSDKPEEGYRSKFDPKNEKAEANYYSVYLDEPKVKAELTTTLRCGIHRYQFDEPKDQHIILDLNHGNNSKAYEATFQVVNEKTIQGVRRVNGWAKDRSVFYYAEFSEPFSDITASIDEKEIDKIQSGEGKKIILAVNFSKPVKEIVVKVGISMVSEEGAKKNFLAEANDKAFEQIRKEGFEVWNKELARVKINASEKDKRVFYTSLYHALVVPNIFNDVDGNFRGIDNQIHNCGEDSHYALFSLWDTFRAAHPLYTVIEPERNEAFVRSLIDKWKRLGHLPKWELHSNDTFCMIGYHAIPVIADAYMKGQRNFDVKEGLKAIAFTSEDEYYDGIALIKKYGYIPADLDTRTVAKALEYAYDDWCVAQMAKEMGEKDIYEKAIVRAQYYKYYFDPTDNFLKGRYSDGKFHSENFDPTAVYHHGKGYYVEGNAWHYAFFVPQDVNTHIDMIGGDEAYANKIDEMFEGENLGEQADDVVDVTGSIGQYTHGNEPSHQVPYLYAYAGQPWKTQMRVKQIIDEMYDDSREGLCGNEDCGQMSAWYILSTMGFYQVAPASNVYVLGTPRFSDVSIALANGKTFDIKAENVSDKNFYVKEVYWNGEPYHKSYITADMLSNGGTLKMVMSNEPNKAFGAAPENRPVARITDFVRTTEELLKSPVSYPEK